MTAYYNELETYAAAWIRNLAAAGHVAAGTVDARSIREVQPRDLDGYAQCHFFAGIGAWSYALRLAGWPDSQPVWTGSCPCQPFSAAGKRGGFADDRHLWPEWFRLIRECRPAIVFGEQVASPDGLRWLDAVSADLENEGYAVGAADLCAAGVGAPHIRQRLYFVAHAERIGGGAGRAGETTRERPEQPDRHGAVGGVGDAAVARPTRGEVAGEDRRDASGGTRGRGEPERASATGELVHAASGGHVGPIEQAGLLHEPRIAGGAVDWSAAEWLPCLDGKARPVEPGSFPLAHGAAARVGRLRAYGNAIVPQVAATFIRAVMPLVLGGAA